MTTIDLDNLQIILDKLVTRLRENGIREISFEDDMYWEIPTDKLASFPEELS